MFSFFYYILHLLFLKQSFFHQRGPISLGARVIRWFLSIYFKKLGLYYCDWAINNIGSRMVFIYETSTFELNFLYYIFYNNKKIIYYIFYFICFSLSRVSLSFKNQLATHRIHVVKWLFNKICLIWQTSWMNLRKNGLGMTWKKTIFYKRPHSSPLCIHYPYILSIYVFSIFRFFCLHQISISDIEYISLINNFW